MQDLDKHSKWNTERSDIAWEFGQACLRLRQTKPLPEMDVLSDILTCVVTELWDGNFSQTEIRTAFENALQSLPTYAAGQDRRSES